MTDAPPPPGPGPIRETIVCVPGPWHLRDDLGSLPDGSRFDDEGRWVAADGVPSGVRLEFSPADPDLPRAFDAAFGGRGDDAARDAVRAHAGVAYLVSGERSGEGCERIAAAASALLAAGGAAVKVENAGIAHTAATWRDLTEVPVPDLYLKAFTVLVRDGRTIRSYGMHVFGLPDAQITGDRPAIETADDLTTFLRDSLTVGTPDLSRGIVFPTSGEEHRAELRVAHGRPSSHPHFNPYGVWHFVPSAEAADPVPEPWDHTVRMLRDVDPKVRANALDALGAFPPGPPPGPLLAALGDAVTDPTPEIRFVAATRLKEVPHLATAVLPRLVEALGHAPMLAAMAAVDTIVACGPAALPLLEKAIVADDRHVSMCAYLARKQILGSDE